MKKLAHIFLIISLLTLCFNCATVSAAGKISLSPANSAINEGQSQVLGIQLDSAITPGNQVTITVISSNPETATISPSTIIFSSSDWSQTKTFTVNVPLNGTYGDTRNVIVLASANSGMAYYSGYAGSAAVHVTDMTPEPGTSAPQDPPEDEDEPPEEDEVVETPTENEVDVAVPNANEAFVSSGPEYVDTIGLSTTWPGNIHKDNKINSVASSLNKMKDTFTPGKVSAQQLFISYLVLTLLLCGVVVIAFYFGRKNWWRRQNARDDRWYYRHLPAKAGKTVKKLRKHPNKTIRKPKRRR